jgi:hypothetical protein
MTPSTKGKIMMSVDRHPSRPGIGRVTRPPFTNIIPARESITRVDDLINLLAHHELRLTYRRYGLSRGVKLDLRVNTKFVGDSVRWEKVEEIIKREFPEIDPARSWKGRYMILVMYEELT